MQFEEAILLAKNGKFVKFQDWGNEYITMVIVNKEVMILKCSSDEVKPYKPSQREMILDAWEEVKEPDTSYITLSKMVRNEYIVSFVYHSVKSNSLLYGIQKLSTPIEIESPREIATLEVAIASGLPDLVDELKIIKLTKMDRRI